MIKKLILLLLPLGLASCATITTPEQTDRVAPAARASAAHPADDVTTGPLTLERTLELAWENNPSLQADYARFEAELLEVPQARSLPDPMAEVSRRQPFSGMSNQETMLGISQMFPWFGKQRLRGEFARAGAMEALEMYHMSFLDLRREVTTAWYMLAYERADQALTLEDRDLLQQSLEATTPLYETGERGLDALLRAQTEIARVESMLPEFDARIEMLERQLARLLGVRAPQLEATLPEDTAMALPDEERLLADAMLYRPELERYAQQELQGELALRLARADYYPDFTLGAGYVAMGDGRDLFPEDRSDSWRASAGINIPLANARRRAAKEQARKRTEEATLRRQAAEDAIVEELFSAISRAKNLDRQLVLIRDTILPLAEEANTAANVSYGTGQAIYLDLLDTQRIFIAARRDLLRVRRDYHLAIADLERAVGAPLAAIPAHEEDKP